MGTKTNISHHKSLRWKVNYFEVGDILKGRVLEKRGNEMFIDLNTFGVGRIYGVFWKQSKDLAKRLNIGDECLVKVVGLDDGQGFVELVLQDVDEISKWQKILEFYKKGTVLELEVKDANKGGLIIDVDGFKGFVPVSNLSPGLYPRVKPNEKDKIYEALRKLVGQKLKFVIISAGSFGEKLILSEKAAQLHKLREILSQYKVGEIVEAKVISYGPFGIFVRFHEDPPLEGLIHNSEIPPELLSDLEGNLPIGKVVKAQIIKIEEDRVNLSLRNLKEDPWVSFAKKYKVGDKVEGVVKERSEIYATISIDDVYGVCFEVEKLKVGQKGNFTIEKIDVNQKNLILKLTE